MTVTATVKRLGDFEIHRELGRGGMGVVYEARQVSLNRKVALKVLAGSVVLHPKSVVRFKREAESAARLHHTNIVPVYATGDQDGTHYYAMELIEGPSLDQVISLLRRERAGEPVAARKHAGPVVQTELIEPTTGPSWAAETRAFETVDTADVVPDVSGAPHNASHSAERSIADLTSTATLQSSGGGGYFDSVARMMAEVADALHYAHEQGVIHRDVKPSNLMLSGQGRLSLNDFGLARMLEQPGVTMTGEFVGSPAYMSPEQIMAGRITVDERTDIYSLGATLYELLTLQPPFTGERRDQLLAQILHKDPRRPRKVDRRVPLDLETICLKALEKDPDKRYRTAGQMAEDLRAYVNRFAISARRIGPVGRAVRWAKRHRGLAVAAACAFVLALVAGLFAWQAHRSDLRLQAAQQQEALDRAMAAAMGGDVGAAEQAIGDAELRGASPGWIRLLRGLLAQNRGDPEAAVRELQQAARMMPDSIAAQALLAGVYTDSAQSTKAEETFAALRQRPARTAEDHLFVGYAQTWWEPELAVREISQALQLRNSPVARSIRSKALAALAVDTGDPTTAEEAMRDADVAKALLPNEPSFLLTSVNARTAAYATYGAAGRADRQQQVLAEAGRDAELAGNACYNRSPSAALARWSYFLLAGDDAAVLREAQRQVALGNSDANFSILRSLLCKGDINAAAELADKLAPAADPMVVLALAERDPARARGLAETSISRGGTGTADVFAPLTLRLLGDNDAARAAARRLRDRAPRLPWRHEWYRNLLEYECGSLSAEGLLESTGASRMNRSEAHFHIALTCLGGGDRAGAREHFQKAADPAGAVFFSEWHWSRVFLARMDQDPQWPRWISSGPKMPGRNQEANGDRN